jgi:hypothetical protein
LYTGKWKYGKMSKTCNEFGTNPIKMISEHKTKLKVDSKTKNIEIVILSHIL